MLKHKLKTFLLSIYLVETLPQKAKKLIAYSVEVSLVVTGLWMGPLSQQSIW